MVIVAPKSEFAISPQVDAEARRLCLNIQEMLKRAAICTLPQGNRRFRDWVFDVRDGVVVALTNVGTMAPVPPGQPDKKSKLTQTPAIHGAKLTKDEFVMFEDHELCNGKGCFACDDGQVQVVRTMKKFGT